MKKGLSTIIVSLILIVISLAAIGVFWLIINNVIKGGSEQIGLDRFIVDAEIKNVGTDNSSNNVSLTFKRKAGAGEMTGIKFVFTDGFNTEIATEEFTLKELEEKRFVFHLTKLLVADLLTI